MLAAEMKQRKKAEDKFRGLLEAAPDAMIITNEEGEIVLINRQTEKLFDYTKEELIGKPVEILIPPDFRNKHVSHRTQYMEAPKVRSMGAGLELFAIRKDGIQFPVEISLSPLITEEGTLISAAVRDITERKKAEEKLKKAKKDFQLLVSSIKDYAIFMLDKNGNVASWNTGAEHIKGYTAEEIIGQPLDVFYTAEEKKRGEPRRNLQMALKDGHFETEGLRVRKDGSTFYANIVFTSLVDEEGELYGYAKVTKDISEKRKAEESIRFLASIADNIQDPVISSDNNTIITRWNKPAEKLFEWKSEEVMGKTTAEILKSSEPIFQSMRIKDFWHGENIFYTKSGNPLNVLVTASHFKDAKGNVTGNLILVRNITERKKAEEALSKLNKELEQRVIERTEKLASSEMRFRSLIENSAEGIALSDEFSNNIYRSPAAEKITGILPKENTINRTHPEDIEMIKNIRKEVLRNPGVPIPFQGRFLNASGHYFWMEGTFTNLLHVKEVNAIVTNYRDITQRKEAEEKIIRSEKIYKTIASSIPGSVICLLDADYRYLLIEGDMLEKLGYSKDQLFGNKAEDVLPPEIFAGVQKEFNRVFEGETITTESSRNGYDIISRFIPLKDENNMVYSIMIVAIDVTELKHAQRDIIELNHSLEEKIIKRTEQLKKSTEEMEAFSYSVSHDLRAPLRGIIGFANILEEDYASKLDDEAKRITRVIKNNTTKMGRLIDDLLTFFRMGRQELVKTNIDTNKIVREIIADFGLNENHKKIEWIIHSLPIIKGDLNTINQVWINLISNAIKYSKNAHNPKIEIGSIEEKGSITFFVKDNGVGFNEKYKAKLFKVFQRLHTNDEFEGTGIGLAIVEKIISKHGGNVWAEAELNKGAVFYFSIPVDNDQKTQLKIK
jgi:PAS domain S-box-containing protein